MALVAQDLVEPAPVNELHGVIGQARRLADVEDRHDVRVVQPRRGLRLAQEALEVRRALASRDVIGQAKGVLMERFKITADEAFGLLVQASQHRNVRVAELAFELAETGDWRGPLPEE